MTRKETEILSGVTVEHQLLSPVLVPGFVIHTDRSAGKVGIVIDSKLHPKLKRCLLAAALTQVQVFGEYSSSGLDNCEEALTQAREMGLSAGRYLARRLHVLRKYRFLTGAN